MSRYTPQPGSIVGRVVEHLRTLDAGAEVPSVVLLDAIGQPQDWHGLSQCLDTAVAHGLLHKRIAGRKAFWRLAVDGDDVRGVDIDRAHSQAIVRASVSTRPSDDDAIVDVAITSTGRLLISAGSQKIALSAAQAEQFFEYLDECRGIEWEGS